MNHDSFGGYHSIDRYVDAKLNRFEQSDRSFPSLFEMMFSERENVMYEESRGYRILSVTYREAYESVKCRAAAMKKEFSDLPEGAVVGLYMDNCLEWIIEFWSILACGFRPLLLNLRLSDAQLSAAINEARADAIVSEGKPFGVRTVNAESLVNASPDHADGIPKGAFGGEILLMSSGTTSMPKICVYTAEEFYNQIRGSYGIIRRCAQMKKHYEGSLKQLTFLPFYHIFGLTAVYVWFAFFSRTFVRLNDMMPQTIVNTIKRHKVTHIFAVPLFWEKVREQALSTIKNRGEETYKKFTRGLSIAEKIGDIPLLGDLFIKIAFREVRENLFGDSICFLISGGSSVSPEVLKFFNYIGYHLANGYGMTEIGITSVELSTKKKQRCSGSVGLPMDGVTYEISPEGELIVSGATMAKYLIEDGEKRPLSCRFATKDLAAKTKNGYLILGRADDLVITPTGENLNPEQIEGQLFVPGVREVCLVGNQTPKGIVATLVVSVGKFTANEVLDEIEQLLRDRLREIGLAGQIGAIYLTTDSLMEEDDFKQNRAKVRRRLFSGALTPARSGAPEPTSAGGEDALTLELARLFGTALSKNENEIPRAADFFTDLGGTSLDYYAVLSHLKSDYDLEFIPESGKSLSSVNDLHDYIIKEQNRIC